MDKIVVPITINEIFLSGIIDTGVEYTLLSTKGAKKAKLLEKMDRRIRGVAGVNKVYVYC